MRAKCPAEIQARIEQVEKDSSALSDGRDDIVAGKLSSSFSREGARVMVAG